MHIYIYTHTSFIPLSADLAYYSNILQIVVLFNNVSIYIYNTILLLYYELIPMNFSTALDRYTIVY